jgi:hypothetical protein
MPSVQDVLREAGIELGESTGAPAVRVECARLATLVRDRQVRILGLVPAGDDVAVPAVALVLGRALAESSPLPVGVLDAQGTWPGARALAARAEPDDPLVATSWVLPGLAVLTPRVPDPAAGLSLLRVLAADLAAVYGHLLVDTTGLDHTGDHLAAFDLLDAVALVARRGRTTTRQLQEKLREIPVGTGLGVLLTGP